MGKGREHRPFTSKVRWRWSNGTGNYEKKKEEKY